MAATTIKKTRKARSSHARRTPDRSSRTQQRRQTMAKTIAAVIAFTLLATLAVPVFF